MCAFVCACNDDLNFYFIFRSMNSSGSSITYSFILVRFQHFHWLKRQFVPIFRFIFRINWNKMRHIRTCYYGTIDGTRGRWWGKLILYRSFPFDLKCQRPEWGIICCLSDGWKWCFKLTVFLFCYCFIFDPNILAHWLCNCFRIELTFCYCSRSIVLDSYRCFPPFNLSFFTLLAQSFARSSLVHIGYLLNGGQNIAWAWTHHIFHNDGRKMVEK